jgi:CBS domain-containing protein
MRVSDMMSVRLVTCEPGMSVADAAREMTAGNVGAALVCDDSRLVGIFSERDVLRLVAERYPVEAERVADHMVREVATIEPDADAADAAAVMNQMRVRHLPVVEGDTPVGMLSLRDFFAISGLVLRAQGADAAGALLRAAT